MHEMFDLLGRFAPMEVNVVLIGETGTGKDMLAHAIHAESARAAGPFVVFDCGAVATNLAESELLGHERGAFTGAVAAHPGAFERAQGGTLFLDEIGELPLEVQPRLLRALDSRKVRRVGGTTERAIDVRIIAATHCDLRAEAAGGTFREDLYFRLAGALVPVPPLRERLEDLPLLVKGVLRDLGQPSVRIPDAVMAVLQQHPWTGNVRELKNALACAVALVDKGGELEERHLRLLARAGQGQSLGELPLAGRTLASIERAAIKQTMLLSQGNKARAARTLDIAVSTLYEKIKKYDL
jgi:transcriptional regulator with PAS, ATPase and Fis domain